MAEEKPDSLGAAEVETRVKAACALVGADYNMTLDQVLGYIHVDKVYSYAHDNNKDLTDAVRTVMQRTMAVDEGLEKLAQETGLDRAAIENLLNWFDVFEYSVANKLYLVDAMKLALETHGSHLLNRAGNNMEGDEDNKQEVKQKKESFDIALQRLRNFKNIPDGRANRSEQREEIARKNREKKVNQTRGIGGSKVSDY